MIENIDEELAKYGLTRQGYEDCLADIRNKLNSNNDMDWDEIVAKYNLPLSRDCVRKASSARPFGFVFVEEYMKSAGKNTKSDNVKNGYLAMLRQEKEEVKIERQKLSDEKLEYNRWLREQARDDLIFEKINAAIKGLPPIDIPEPIAKNENSKTGILCFGDTHYGTEFEIKGLDGEVINRYNPDVFEQRMWDLFWQVVTKVVEKEELDTIKVYDLGDEIDGILRCSQLMKLRYGVVEQAIRYAEFICRWLGLLTNYVNVEYQMVGGNHSELRMISQPKGTFKDDNMAEVVREYIAIRMEGNENFTMTKNESGLIFDTIQGYNVLGIHGEVRNMTKALQDFSNVYNKKIDVLIGGHNHHLYTETCGVNRDVVSIPSIIGIDDFSMSLQRVSNPGATFLIIEEKKGLVEQTTFKFSV